MCSMSPIYTEEVGALNLQQTLSGALGMRFRIRGVYAAVWRLCAVIYRSKYKYKFVLFGAAAALFAPNGMATRRWNILWNGTMVN